MFFWYRTGEERNDDHCEEAEKKEDDGEVQEVDLGDDARSEVLLSTLGAAVPKVQTHPDQSHHQPNHQPPEGPLCTKKKISVTNHQPPEGPLCTIKKISVTNHQPPEGPLCTKQKTKTSTMTTSGTPRAFL